MFIRSSTATNDCLISLNEIKTIEKREDTLDHVGEPAITFTLKDELEWRAFIYSSKEERDKAYNELCEYLTSNYKLRDFT